MVEATYLKGVCSRDALILVSGLPSNSLIFFGVVEVFLVLGIGKYLRPKYNYYIGLKEWYCCIPSV